VPNAVHRAPEIDGSGPAARSTTARQRSRASAARIPILGFWTCPPLPYETLFDVGEARSRHAILLLYIGMTLLSFDRAALYFGLGTPEPAQATGRGCPPSNGNRRGSRAAIANPETHSESNMWRVFCAALVCQKCSRAVARRRSSPDGWPERHFNHCRICLNLLPRSSADRRGRIARSRTDAGGWDGSAGCCAERRSPRSRAARCRL